MPARVTVIPEWAEHDPFVAMLLREIAILRGTTYAVQRYNHGLGHEPDDPRGGGKRPSAGHREGTPA